MWEATPDSVGVWPYHDHGPNHTLNTFRGAFGAVVIRERGAQGPDIEEVLFMHQLQPPVTGLERTFQAINGRTGAGNTPTIETRVGQDVALHVIGMDNEFHDFHIHGHRWRDAAGAFVDTPVAGAERDDHGALRRGQPGPLALPLPCLLAPGRGHGGVVPGEPMRRGRRMGHRSTFAAAALAAAALLAPAGALAQEPSYPEPADPGQVEPRPRGEGKTRVVCKRGCRFKRIQAAVDASAAGDTVRVRKGTYRESVRIRGRGKRYLRLIGDPGRPSRVVLQGGNGRQNGVLVDGADEVTVRGFKARGYAANGFFFVNVVGYTARDLIAARTGVYGIYAFNSKGGTMRDSEAYYTSDAGFYIGQTPAQVRPIRSVVRNISSWGNPLGWSGTNMRYVTITDSRFYNNALGLVPNALDSEKFPPAEDNVIRDNDIFWNNFNFHRGAPFRIRDSGRGRAGAGRHRRAAARRPAQRRRGQPDLRQLRRRRRAGRGRSCCRRTRRRARSVGNVVRDNAFGLGGTDLNGRELAYDGNGSGNCFSGNTGVVGDDPGRRLDARAVPVRRPQRVQRADAGDHAEPGGRGKRGAVDPPSARAQAGLRAAGAVHAVTGRRILATACAAGAALVCAAPAGAGGGPAPQRKAVEVADNYYLPAKLTVKQGAKVIWKWPDDVAIDVHDVKLESGPRGVREFQSEPASSGYRYTRTLQAARALRDRLHAARGDDDADHGAPPLSGSVRRAAYARAPWPP